MGSDMGFLLWVMGMRNWPPRAGAADGSSVLRIGQSARIGLQTGGQSGRWAVLSVPVLALEGGEDQVAHVMDIALDTGEAVMIDLAILVTALLDAGALLVQLLLQLVQQRFIGERLSCHRRGEPCYEGSYAGIWVMA
jgi:hypothetical protein